MATRKGPFCGADRRNGEGLCRLPAGRGTSHEGTGHCSWHGGASPSGIMSALNKQAAAELARLDVPPVTDPLTELARLAGQAVAWKDAMAAKVNELASLRYESATGGEQLRAEIALWERSLDRCISTLGAMARLNIEDRLAGIKRRTADMLELALTQALQKSGADLAGQAAAREEFRRNLRIVA